MEVILQIVTASMANTDSNSDQGGGRATNNLRDWRERLEEELTGRSGLLLMHATLPLQQQQQTPMSSLLGGIFSLMSHGSKCTMGMAVLLKCQAGTLIDQGASSPNLVFRPAFMEAVKQFIALADKEEAAMVCKEVDFILRVFMRLQKPNEEAACLRTLSLAIELTAPSEFCLTPSHAHFLQLCMSGRLYFYGVSFIRKTQVLEIQPKANSLTPLDYLKYFYYCGMCLVAVKDYPAALEALMVAIVTPANGVVSEVMVKALKKAKLVQLILTGQALTLPKYTCNAVIRYSSTQSMGPYENIAKEYLQSSMQGLLASIRADKSKAALETDLNYGLAEQVIESFITHRIKRLTKAYASMSLSAIAVAADVGYSRLALPHEKRTFVEKPEKKASGSSSSSSSRSSNNSSSISSSGISSSSSSASVNDTVSDDGEGGDNGNGEGEENAGTGAPAGPPAIETAEKIIALLAGEGVIKAKIDKATGIVRFDSPKASEALSIGILENSIAETIETSTQLRELQKSLLTSQAYVMKTSAGSGSMLSSFGFGSHHTVQYG